MTRALVLRHHLEDHSGLIGEAHRAAMEQFMIRGMARKKNRAGVQGNRI